MCYIFKLQFTGLELKPYFLIFFLLITPPFLLIFTYKEGINGYLEGFIPLIFSIPLGEKSFIWIFLQSEKVYLFNGKVFLSILFLVLYFLSFFPSPSDASLPSGYKTSLLKEGEFYTEGGRGKG